MLRQLEVFIVEEVKNRKVEKYVLKTVLYLHTNMYSWWLPLEMTESEHFEWQRRRQSESTIFVEACTVQIILVVERLSEEQKIIQQPTP